MKLKISRNDNCWCGSEKKYKVCHLEMDEKLESFARQGYPIPRKKLIKSQEQIDGIRKSSQLTSKILDELSNIIKPGMTTNAINDWVHTTTLQHGAIPAPLNYKGYPKSICTSLNDVVCHGIPDDTRLKDGDILNVDVTCILNGYYGDSCRMYEIGSVSDEAHKLCAITKECLQLAIDQVKPYVSVSVIGDAIQAHAHQHGYSVVEAFGGHGIGTSFHDDPFIFHFSRPEKQMIMAPGMVFTIEPMINVGKHQCKVLADEWTAVTRDGSLSAQWEHTILVTETGSEILTKTHAKTRI